jgi:hypothetical protein
MKKIFLGGTCNGSKWREELIPLLKIDYFNPVVADWTPECQEREVKERETADYCLYVITPKMTGVYSIAEVTDDSNKRPEKTIFCILETDGDAKFTPAQYKSLIQTAKLVKGNGATIFLTLDTVANYVNEKND